jgi:hypothetical protein
MSRNNSFKISKSLISERVVFFCFTNYDPNRGGSGSPVAGFFVGFFLSGDPKQVKLNQKLLLDHADIGKSK